MSERWTLHHVSGQAGDAAIVTGPAIWRGAGDEPVEVVRASTYQGAVDAYLSELVAESRTICEREGVSNLAEWIGKTVLARVTGEGQ